MLLLAPPSVTVLHSLPPKHATGSNKASACYWRAGSSFDNDRSRIAGVNVKWKINIYARARQGSLKPFHNEIMFAIVVCVFIEARGNVARCSLSASDRGISFPHLRSEAVVFSIFGSLKCVRSTPPEHLCINAADWRKNECR